MVKGQASVTRIVLPESLRAESTLELVELLAQHLRDPHTVLLDAPGVCVVHSAALQILLAFVREREEAGNATQWLSPSEALRRSATQSGLATALGLAKH